MSWNNDTCDFCKTYMDPIGCDTKTPIGELAWCGQCYEGMHYQWRNYTDDDLAKIGAYYQAEYDRDPIDFDSPTSADASPGEQFVAMQRRMHQLHCLDTATQIRTYIEMCTERQAEAS